VATLHQVKNAQNQNNNTELTLFQESPPHSFNFTKYYDFKTKNARRMDCTSTADKSGLVVVVNNIEDNHPLTHEAELDMGSPVFRITETAKGKVEPVELVQFFNRLNQDRVDLYVHGNDIFLIQTIETYNTTLRPHCPIFKWTGFNFNLIQELPCMNAVEVQKFTIHQEFYVAFANHRNDEGATNIFSYVYKLDVVAEKFELHQRLFTNAATDVRYFYFDNDHVREHFLIVGNSFELGKNNFNSVS
jgi:EPTP domain